MNRHLHASYRSNQDGEITIRKRLKTGPLWSIRLRKFLHSFWELINSARQHLMHSHQQRGDQFTLE